jgi:hypothetical protein
MPSTPARRDLTVLERHELPGTSHLSSHPTRSICARCWLLAEIARRRRKLVALGLQPAVVEMQTEVEPAVEAALELLRIWWRTAWRRRDIASTDTARQPMHELSLALEVCRLAEEVMAWSEASLFGAWGSRLAVRPGSSWTISGSVSTP